MKSKHPATRYFMASKLFDGLNTFAEFEARITALPNNKERGDAFEVFAEAYLATQKINKAHEVWPFESIPREQRRLLALDTGRDMGVDGTYQTHGGELRAYQVKFRSNRSALTWDELSTFMGLTDQVSQRVLFTNCEALPSLMQDRSDFSAIRGSDLDRLVPEDFEAMRWWMHTGTVKYPHKQPKPHQKEALAAISSNFNDNDRATIVMACGTGKSLVGLWVAEQNGYRNVLVLLPSLALVRQLLHDWLHETSWEKLDYLCVCSDPSVAKGVDDLIVHQADLDFLVTTESAKVSKFISNQFDGVKVIFSTYQSAHIVAEGMPIGADGERKPFDLAIFDEAHKTASRGGTQFSFALTDENLPIHKRLFFTATPRHYDIRKKDKEGDNALVYSMDNREVYGQIAHTLSFAEAARRGIICDYKVVISVVTSEMLDDYVLKHGEVIVAGDAVKARQVALQIGLKKAVEKYGVSRIFTFHGSVQAAKSFTSNDSEGILQHLDGFQTFHVNGAMPTARREDYMKAFRQADRAVMSNARCLTEGVDVPAVDMVSFMSPRKSKVDIVQATGRAMRNSPGKQLGYVMVPLFLEMINDETIEEALHRTDFSDVWNVLSAMKEQDDVLIDIIRQMREDRGRTGGYDETRLKERVEVLGPVVSLEVISESIATQCVERLGVTWDERYGELMAYKERFGDCRVPYKWPTNPQLGTWVVVQRRTKKTGELSEERIFRLDRIEFQWDAFDAYWEEKYTDLLKYKEEYGDCNIPTRWSENRQLATWADGQRQARKNGILETARIERLDAIGFTWDLHEQYWDKMFMELLEFKKANGNCAVTDKWIKDRPLSTWVGNQRRKKAQLTKEQIRRLDEIGFIWTPKDTFWAEMFEKLVAYKTTHGHCNVPQEWVEDKKLGNWVFNQRRAKRKGWLDEQRTTKLEKIGFLWELPSYDVFWDEMYVALVEYKELHGHCNPPPKCDENPQLGIWVGNQRSARKKDKLSEHQIRQLDELGFSWAPRGDSWDDKYTLLVEYKNTHGHCNVPSDFPVLGRWVNKQRQAAKHGTLTRDHSARLDAIGFVWNILELSWNEMIDALADFKRVHGHCNVPQSWRDNPKLARWVNTQRMEKKRETMTADRVSRLDALGFVWNLRDLSNGE